MVTTRSRAAACSSSRLSLTSCPSTPRLPALPDMSSVSHVTYHMSHVTRHLSHVTCHCASGRVGWELELGAPLECPGLGVRASKFDSTYRTEFRLQKHTTPRTRVTRQRWRARAAAGATPMPYRTTLILKRCRVRIKAAVLEMRMHCAITCRLDACLGLNFKPKKHELKGFSRLKKQSPSA